METVSILRITGTKLTSGMCAGMAQAPEEQIGQECDAAGPDVKSAQWWNCPATKAGTRSRVTRKKLRVDISILPDKTPFMPQRLQVAASRNYLSSRCVYNSQEDVYASVRLVR